MSDVFLSYKREDLERVEPLIRELRSAGLSLWWDRKIGGGERWRERIAKELDAARCVVVVWSTQSVGPEGTFVHDEASRAQKRGVLVPVRIDDVDPPVGFGEIQALDLVGWTGKPDDLRFEDVLDTVRAQIARKPRPKPRWPSQRRRNIVLAGGGGLLTPVVVALMLLNADLRETICRVPGVRSICGRLGIGRVPGEAEHRLWLEAIAQTSGDGLREYLRVYSDGVYAEEARSKLAACRKVPEETWRRETMRPPLVVRPQLDPLPSKAQAQQDARKRGKEEAAFVCEGYTVGRYFRLLSSSFDPRTWDCSPRGSGFVCGFDGQAVCQLKARITHDREVCDASAEEAGSGNEAAVEKER